MQDLLYAALDLLSELVLAISMFAGRRARGTGHHRRRISGLKRRLPALRRRVSVRAIQAMVYLSPPAVRFKGEEPMPRKVPPKEKLEEFKEFMSGMMAMRLDVLGANATKYAEVLGAFRAALEKAGFSSEEAMQIVLKVADQQGRRPMHRGQHDGHWHKT